MKKEGSRLTNNNCKKVTETSLRRWHEPRPSEEKLRQYFSHSTCRDPDEGIIFGHSRNRKRIFVTATCQDKGGEGDR